MDGVQLGARFSIATNRLQYCGPADAEPLLYRAITRGSDLAEARGSLARFEALMPYLEAIATKHGRDPFDREVVEAYWIGNSLLDAFDRADFRRLLQALVARGLPRGIAARLDRYLPERPIPHHVFHVAFVGVGAVTGHVPTTLPNMEACRPSWGEVRERSDHTVAIEAPALELRSGRLALGASRTLRLPEDRLVTPALHVGETVAFHWQCLALALSRSQDAALREYTQRSLDAANEALPALGVL